jgi:tRNA1Val (adenine37-N6)-methyltransferase
MIESPDSPGTASGAATPGRLIIRQPERGYRFSIDSVILAGFAASFCRGAVLDLGTGCGVLLLLLSRLAPGMQAGIGVELQEDLLAFARRNFRDNCPDGRLVAEAGDFRGAVPGVEPGSFDLVVSNPPYGRAGHGRRNPDPGKETARHDVTCALPELFSAASRHLSAIGRFAFILPYQRLSEVEPCAAKEGLRVEFVRVVHPRDGERPSRGLCCAVRGGGGTPRLLPPLFLHGGPEKYCPEVERICRLFRAG